MSIISLQRKQRELGRIRLGDKGSKGQPQRLSKFRLTSPAKHLLDHAAALWGGEVRQWAGAPSEGSWELYTETDVLPIIIPPISEPLTSWYESWSAGGCTRRCDGATDTITGEPCSCDPDNRICKPTSRLSVMLPDLPDVGTWLLQSHGYYAAMELPGTIDVLQMAGDSGRFLEGRLRIEHRKKVAGGQTSRFIVPVIDLDVTMKSLMSGAPDIPETIEAPKDVPALPAPEPEPSGETIKPSQIAGIMIAAREQGLSENEVKAIVYQIAGVKSRKDIPADKYAEVMSAINGQMVPEQPPREVD